MDSITVSDSVPGWRRGARRAIAAPGLRLLAPGWPDAGRRIVQTPALRPLLRKAVELHPAPRFVVNAGAGEGLYNPLIREAVGDARLLEFDFAQPGRLLRLNDNRFRASLAAIALPSAIADLIVCTEVLEHVEDDRSAVAELRRVLRPRGMLVLSVPTPPAVFDPAHVREGYTLSNLRALFDSEGLEILEARYCMHLFFQSVLRFWRPYVFPLGAILGLAWMDRVLRLGPPMDLAVLARTRD